MQFVCADLLCTVGTYVYYFWFSQFFLLFFHPMKPLSSGQGELKLWIFYVSDDSLSSGVERKIPKKISQSMWNRKNYHWLFFELVSTDGEYARIFVGTVRIQYCFCVFHFIIQQYSLFRISCLRCMHMYNIHSMKFHLSDWKEHNNEVNENILCLLYPLFIYLLISSFILYISSNKNKITNKIYIIQSLGARMSKYVK